MHKKRATVSMLIAAAMVLGTSGSRADEAAAAKEAAGDEKDWSVEAGYDFFSLYLFRGVDILKGHPVHVPHVAVGWKGLSAYYWGYYGDGDRSLKKNDTYEEFDYGGEYTHTLIEDKLSLTVGGLGYIYHDNLSGQDTFELYGAASYDTLMQPSATINWDVDELHGGYGTVGISHSFDLTETLGLKEPMTVSIDAGATLGIDFGYNSRVSGSNVDFNDFLMSVYVPWQITDYLSVHGLVQLSIALSALNDIGQGNEWVFGLGANLTF